VSWILTQRLTEWWSDSELRSQWSNESGVANRRRGCCLSDGASGKKKSIQASACTPVHTTDCLNSLDGDRKDE